MASVVNLGNALGTCPAWGITPAMDVSGEGASNVLMIGGGNMGHILKTMGEGRAPATIYVVYEDVESMCRDLLLLSIAMDLDNGVEERVELFLEVFSNALLRDKTNTYLIQIASQLLRFVTSFDHPDEYLSGVVVLDQLKFKSRDMLERCLRFVIDKVPFDIAMFRDQRLRSYYGVRYDVRTNLVDWDYMMNLRHHASIIHRLHYTEWRNLGQAFEVRDAKYTVPNRTMASYRAAKKKSTGTSVSVRGFWGDLVASPYITFGVEAPDCPGLFEMRGDQHVSTSVDVSRHNVERLLSALRKEGGARGMRIVPVLGFEAMAGRSQYQSLFDMVFMPAGSTVAFDHPRLKAMLRDEARIVIETLKFVGSVSAKDQRLYYDKVKELGRAARCAIIVKSSDNTEEVPAVVTFAP